MSASKTYVPTICWLVGVLGFLCLLWIGHARFSAAPTSPRPIIVAGPNFTLPLRPPVPAPELEPFDRDSTVYAMFAFPLRGLYPAGEGLIDLRGEPVGHGIQILRRDAVPEVVTGDPKISLSNSLHSFEFPFARIRVGLTGTTEEGEEKNFEVETAVVTAQSAAWGCGNCHGRERNHEDRYGLAPQTEKNILAAHDRLNGTDLLARAAQPDALRCASCHGEDTALPNLSTAMHGVHALMAPADDERACNSCHPADSKGVSLLQRDLHADMGIGCTSCHGTLREHALSLLKAEADAGKVSSKKRFAQVAAAAGEGTAAEDILPRLPGENLPDCAGCHSFTEHPIPGEAKAFNKWTEKAAERYSRRFDYTGKLRCPTCHGAPHTMYRAKDLTGDNRDNFQATYYLRGDGPIGSNKTCSTCHKMEMDYFVHHGLPE